MIFQKMVSQGESFTLLAVPFFVAVGVIMNYSGIATRLMNVADMITGRMVGGPAQSNVVLSALMGGVSVPPMRTRPWRSRCWCRR